MLRALTSAQVISLVCFVGLCLYLYYDARRAKAGKEVVAYCRGPYCVMAFDAVKTLRRHGRRARRLVEGFPEWRAAGLPVPPGFTIQTEACREYMRHNSVSREVDSQMEAALATLEGLQGQKLGKGENPLLVSVRSGAKFSMPGMMDTILNLGLNDQSVEALAKRSNNPRFAFDSYRRLIQMFGNVVLDIEKSEFEEVFDGKKKQRKVKLDTELDAKALKEVIEEYKKVVKKAPAKAAKK